MTASIRLFVDLTTSVNVCVCRQRLFENLRMLPHAPGVQMQAIPEDAVQEDSGDEEEEDPNKRISSKQDPHTHIVLIKTVLENVNFLLQENTKPYNTLFYFVVCV